MSARWLTRLAAVMVAALMSLGTPLSSHAMTGADDLVAQGEIHFAPGIPLVGGAGSFDFVSTACQLVSDGELPPDSPVPEMVGCTLTSTGTYSSVACGTMTLSGTATLTGEPEGALRVSYTAQVVDGAGPVEGTALTPTGQVLAVVGVVVVGVISVFNPIVGGICAVVGALTLKWLFKSSP